MDIFNLEKVENLEQENVRLKFRLSEMESRAIRAENSLAKFMEIRDSIPADCIEGTYCRGCAFVKEYYYNGAFHRGPVITGYYCGKGESCKNFIQKKVEEK